MRARQPPGYSSLMARAKKPAEGLGEKLEVAQRETNRRLDRIEQTLETSSKLFELMHERLLGLEKGQTASNESQKLIIDRLDRLIEATTRDRTEWLQRFTAIDDLRLRVERLERACYEPHEPSGH